MLAHDDTFKFMVRRDQQTHDVAKSLEHDEETMVLVKHLRREAARKLRALTVS